MSTLSVARYVSLVAEYYPDEDPESLCQEYSKALLAFSIPSELRGVSIDSAVLTLSRLYTGTGALSNVLAKTCVSSWSTADSVSVLNSLSLSSALDTKSISTSETSTTFNVLGTSSEGVKEACANSRSEITIVIEKSGLTTPSAKTNYVRVGSSTLSLDDVKYFDVTATLTIEAGGTSFVLALGSGVVV